MQATPAASSSGWLSYPAQVSILFPHGLLFTSSGWSNLIWVCFLFSSLLCPVFHLVWHYWSDQVCVSLLPPFSLPFFPSSSSFPSFPFSLSYHSFIHSMLTCFWQLLRIVMFTMDESLLDVSFCSEVSFCMSEPDDQPQSINVDLSNGSPRPWQRYSGRCSLEY